MFICGCNPVSYSNGGKCNRIKRIVLSGYKSPALKTSSSTLEYKQWRNKPIKPSGKEIAKEGAKVCVWRWVGDSHVNWGGKWGRHYHTVWHISFSTPCWGICHFASEGFPVRDKPSRWAYAPLRAARSMIWAIMDVKYHKTVLLLLLQICYCAFMENFLGGTP